jgi:hypothetical protein
VTLEELQKLAQQFGGFSQLQSAVGKHRGEPGVPGVIDPRFAGRSTSDLAEIDRYGHFGNSGEEMQGLGMLGLPSAALVAVANEYGAKNKTIGKFLAAVLGDKQYLVNETTSPSSFGNVKSGVRGYIDGVLSGRPNSQRLQAEEAKKRRKQEEDKRRLMAAIAPETVTLR